MDNIDSRARELGEQIGAHFREHDDRCVMITGAGHTGKTQSAMVVRSMLDPDGQSSIHTSAAIISTNSRLVPSDRSAKWQSWDRLLDFQKADQAPALLIIDEAGSSLPPTSPIDLTQAIAKRVLSDFAARGTKFIVIGHTPNANLEAWAQWLSGDRSHYAAVDTRG